MKHTLRAFRHRNYRLFFCGQSVSIIGTWVQQIAMSWLVYRLTGSAWLLGVTGFAGQIAVLLFAPFGGLWADRFDRRMLLIVTQAMAMLLGFALALLAWTDLVAVWHVILIATLAGCVLAFDAPIRSSFTPEMVPSRQDLPGAIALNGGMQNGGRMVGPAVGGMLLALTSEAFCFLVNGLSKLAIITSLLLMKIAPQPKLARDARIWASFREGAVYAWNLVPVRWLLPMVALVSFTVTPYLTLMPIFAAEIYGGGAETLGFLVGAAGLGGVIGVLYLASRRDVRGLARWTAKAAALSGAAIIAFSYSRSLPLSLLLMAVTGFGIIVTAMSVNMIIQTIVENEKRGRVVSFFTMSFLGMHPLGSLAAGALATWIGASHTLAVGGLCSIIGALLLWRRLPLLRNHLRPIYEKLGIGK
jgi:MFS family permease